MHPARILLILMLCVFVMWAAVARSPFRQVVETTQTCVTPLSPRTIGMDPYDPADFARHALQRMAEGDIIGQAYVCWPHFLSKTRTPARVPLGARIAASVYKYLPTSDLRASIREQFLQALASDVRTTVGQLRSGSLVSSDTTSELVRFELEAGTLNVSLISEDGLRYVSGLELSAPSASTNSATAAE